MLFLLLNYKKIIDANHQGRLSKNAASEMEKVNN
jgi:hypothetical protein